MFRTFAMTHSRRLFPNQIVENWDCFSATATNCRFLGLEAWNSICFPLGHFLAVDLRFKSFKAKRASLRSILKAFELPQDKILVGLIAKF
ncbi:hypothetical protein L2E82_03462 [Cichorium intybus]|uniref:Uncharacterized protein n=1 Tax=Cichorium intybus TaxID=13427 RepID=A0ACB9H5I0_CICIN|nr:hypothetical protein L2E82_03462 [Cichorium intybus]